jgi:hypothetical protein
MSIASEIARIKQNIVDAYEACLTKGATMPDEQNSNNLAETILSIIMGSANNATEEQINAILTQMSIEEIDGDLIVNIPDNVDIDFYLDEEGNLIVEEDYSNIEFKLNNNNLEVQYG